MFRGALFPAGVAALGNHHSFTVAEVKPHFGCADPAGQDAVRAHITELVSQGTGLISLLQMQFPLEQPSHYTAFGGQCKSKYSDQAVMLVDEKQFEVKQAIGRTLSGNYSAMPFLAGSVPEDGPMCVSDPETVRKNITMGERAYAGAVLLHKASGRELCVVTGTLPHWGSGQCGDDIFVPWLDQFKSDVGQCGDRPLLVMADTNAGCATQPDGGEESRKYDMGDIAKSQGVDLGGCSDPGVEALPTCCNDTKSLNVSDPHYAFDRTAMCKNGGTVDKFTVESHYYCGANSEHRFTRATVTLGKPSTTTTTTTIDPKNVCGHDDDDETIVLDDWETHEDVSRRYCACGCSQSTCLEKTEHGLAKGPCFTKHQIEAGNTEEPQGCNYGSAANTCALDDNGQCVYSKLGSEMYTQCPSSGITV